MALAAVVASSDRSVTNYNFLGALEPHAIDMTEQNPKRLRGEQEEHARQQTPPPARQASLEAILMQQTQLLQHLVAKTGSSTGSSYDMMFQSPGKLLSKFDPILQPTVVK